MQAFLAARAERCRRDRISNEKRFPDKVEIVQEIEDALVKTADAFGESLATLAVKPHLSKQDNKTYFNNVYTSTRLFAYNSMANRYLEQVHKNYHDDAHTMFTGDVLPDNVDPDPEKMNSLTSSFTRFSLLTGKDNDWAVREAVFGASWLNVAKNLNDMVKTIDEQAIVEQNLGAVMTSALMVDPGPVSLSDPSPEAVSLAQLHLHTKSPYAIPGEPLKPVPADTEMIKNAMSLVLPPDLLPFLDDIDIDKLPGQMSEEQINQLTQQVRKSLFAYFDSLAPRTTTRNVIDVPVSFGQLVEVGTNGLLEKSTAAPGDGTDFETLATCLILLISSLIWFFRTYLPRANFDMRNTAFMTSFVTEMVIRPMSVALPILVQLADPNSPDLPRLNEIAEIATGSGGFLNTTLFAAGLGGVAAYASVTNGNNTRKLISFAILASLAGIFYTYADVDSIFAALSDNIGMVMFQLAGIAKPYAIDVGKTITGKDGLGKFLGELMQTYAGTEVPTVVEAVNLGNGNEANEKVESWWSLQTSSWFGLFASSPVAAAAADDGASAAAEKTVPSFINEKTMDAINKAMPMGRYILNTLKAGTLASGDYLVMSVSEGFRKLTVATRASQAIEGFEKYARYFFGDNMLVSMLQTGAVAFSATKAISLLMADPLKLSLGLVMLTFAAILPKITDLMKGTSFGFSIAPPVISKNANPLIANTTKIIMGTYNQEHDFFDQVQRDEYVKQWGMAGIPYFLLRWLGYSFASNAAKTLSIASNVLLRGFPIVGVDRPLDNLDLLHTLAILPQFPTTLAVTSVFTTVLEIGSQVVYQRQTERNRFVETVRPILQQMIRELETNMPAEPTTRGKTDLLVLINQAKRLIPQENGPYDRERLQKTIDNNSVAIRSALSTFQSLEDDQHVNEGRIYEWMTKMITDKDGEVASYRDWFDNGPFVMNTCKDSTKLPDAHRKMLGIEDIVQAYYYSEKTGVAVPTSFAFEEINKDVVNVDRSKIKDAIVRKLQSVSKTYFETQTDESDKYFASIDAFNVFGSETHRKLAGPVAIGNVPIEWFELGSYRGTYEKFTILPALALFESIRKTHTQTQDHDRQILAVLDLIMVEQRVNLEKFAFVFRDMLTKDEFTNFINSSTFNKNQTDQVTNASVLSVVTMVEGEFGMNPQFDLFRVAILDKFLTALVLSSQKIPEDVVVLMHSTTALLRLVHKISLLVMTKLKAKKLSKQHQQAFVGLVKLV